MQQFTNYSAWYQAHYPDLYQNGLWLKGQELNTLKPSEFEKRNFKILFTRLSTYFDTGYSFTHQLLYQIAAHMPGVYPDLAYLPPKSDLKIFAQHNVPWLLSTQSKVGPQAFDMIGISNSIVQELINLPSLLKNSGIALKKSERMADDGVPLIILGGANALYSSVLWNDDSLVDGIFVGENDQEIKKLISIAQQAKKQKLSKVATLDWLVQEVEGFFLPEKPQAIRKNFIANLNQSQALEKGPIYYIEDQMGSSHLQISEGCPCFCSFCAESWDRKPYRERSAQKLKEVSLRAKAAMGLDRIDIYSFNFNMHSELYQILWDLVPHFRVLGLKSQRFDLLAHDPQMVQFQHAIEKASITCGLEGISPRLRKYLHKNLENDQLHDSLTAIFKSNARELKIFLIATGLEQEQDFVALNDFLDHLKEIQNACHAYPRIIFSMTPLVRFPWTPLEFEDGIAIAQYQKIIDHTARIIGKAGFEFRESADLPEYWVSQVLVRADNSKIYQALLKTIDQTNFVYYRTINESFLQRFQQELLAQQLDLTSLIAGHDLATSYNKPWAQVNTGVKREFLWEEVLRARSFVELDYCLGRAWTKANCFHCGGCPTRFHVRDIVLSKQTRNYNLTQFVERVQSSRKNEISKKFKIKVLPQARGVPRKLLGVALARSLMLSHPFLAETYRGFKDSRFLAFNHGVWLTGYDVIELNFSQDFELNQLALAAINTLAEGWFELIEEVPVELSIGAMVLEFSDGKNFQPDRFFKSLGLKYILKKIDSTSYRYEVIAASQKKNIILAMIELRQQSNPKLLLRVGSKFNLDEFVKQAFNFKNPNDRVRMAIEVKALELPDQNKSKLNDLALSF